MFESILADALNKALGKYCEVVDAEKLRVSALRGDVLLRNVQLKRDALKQLDAPVTVDAGVIGSLRLKVPWTKLGQEPVVVEIDRVFLLATRVEMDDATRARGGDEEEGAEDEDEDAKARVRSERLRKGEFDWLKASMGKVKKEVESAVANAGEGRTKSWMWSLFGTVIGNLQVTVTNVHCRYEDAITTPGNKFSCGLTIGTLSAITVDDDGNPTFTTSDMLSRIHKHVKLANFALYLDSGTLSTPWKTHDGWRPPDSNDVEGWWALFGVGLNEEAPSAMRHYVLHPVSVDLFYHRKSKKEVKNLPDAPRQIFDLRFQDSRVALSRKQYYNLMRLLDVFNQFRMRLPHAELRPKILLTTNPKAWWTYAIGALIKRQKKVSGRIKWSDIQLAGRQRRKYLAMYTAEGFGENEEIIQSVQDIESELDFEVALAWRCIAHSVTRVISEPKSPSLAALARARVKDAIAKESAPQQSSYLPWRWSRTTKVDQSIEDDSSDSQMTEADWSKLDEVMGVTAHAEEEEELSGCGLEFKGQIRRVSWELKDHDDNDVERPVMSSTMSGAHVSSNKYGEHVKTVLTIEGWACDTTSERILVSGESGARALKIEHNLYPLEHEFDMSVDVKVAPVYGVFEYSTIDQLKNFFSSTDAPQANFMSLQDEAVEKIEMARTSAAAALSKKIFMNFEIDAPKVTIPVRHNGRVAFQTLVDFGHFNFVADPRLDYAMVDRKTGAPVYQTFTITGTDMAVFLADSSFDWKTAADLDLTSVCVPILAPCKAAVRLRIQGPGWTYETGPKIDVSFTTAEVQTYISPTKIARLFATLQAVTTSTKELMLNSVEESGTIAAKPWNDTLLSGPSSAMKVGLVGATSGYHGRWLCVNGSYLYILEGPGAPMYIDYVRIGANLRISVLDGEDDEDNTGPILAIHDAKVPKSRAAGTNGTWLLRFASDGELSKWERWLHDLNKTARATGRLAKVENEGDSESPPVELTVAAGSVVEFALSLSFGDLRAHLCGQSMGVPGAYRDGFENGGVARALNRDLKDSTEIPIATLVAQSANVLLEIADCSRALNLSVSTLDIIDELCAMPQPLRLVSAQPKTATDDFKVQLNYKQLSLSSPDYVGVDTTLSLNTENIIIAIHRPTIGSLWRMWEEIKIILAAYSVPDSKDMKSSPTSDSFAADDPNRIGFKLVLHFDSTIIKAFRERRDGEMELRPLFDCYMDDLGLEMCGKLTTMDLGISLGNLRVTDLSLPEGNAYRHLVDLKSAAEDSSLTSRTHVDVRIYNHLAIDFPGHEYDVRIKADNLQVNVVYAFIQKLLGFFSGFLPPPIPISALPESERNAELLRRGEPRPFTMVYTVDLAVPEVIIPRSSASNQALCLDVESVHLENALKWTFGKSHRDFGSVLLDTTKVSMVRFSTCVRNRHKKRPSMMPGCKASANVVMRRSKWDASGRVPGMEMVVEIPDHVEFEIDDGEYRMLRALAAENFAEESEVPAPLYDVSPDLEHLKSFDESFAHVPKALIALYVNKVRMTIFGGGSRVNRFKVIGSFAIEDMQFSLKQKRNDELAMTVTFPNLVLSDLRVGTSVKAQQVFGSSSAVNDVQTLLQVDVSASQSAIDIKALLQSCRIMNHPQFALAVYNFFILKSENESESGFVNELLMQDLDFGDRSLLTLNSHTELNASKRILCDSPSGKQAVELHGNGHELVFRAKHNSLIYIAAGRSLKLINMCVVLPIGTTLSDFIQLEPDAQLIANESDGVRIVCETRLSDSQNDLTLESKSKPPVEMRFQLLAPQLEVMFLDAAAKDDEYMLRVRTDAEFGYAALAGLNEATFALTQFQVAVSEWSKAGTVLDASVVLKPMDLDGRVRAASDDIELMIRSTTVDFVLDAQSIQRVLAISKGIRTTLQSTGLYNQTVPCSQFTHVGSVHNGMNFWRPVPPPGFAVLGDCVTMSDAPPSRPVTVITDADGLTKIPVRYERACALDTSTQGVRLYIWTPVAPDGYCALGCVVTCDDVQPTLEAMRCVRAEVVCAAHYGACVSSKTSNARVHISHNSSCTFHVSVGGANPMPPVDLRRPLLPAYSQLTAVETAADELVASATSDDSLRTQTTYDLVCVWSDLDEHGNRQASIWHPKPPAGYVSLGDCLVAGRDPPQAGVLVAEFEGGAVAHPNGYVLIGELPQGSHEGGDYKTLGIWHPLPPSGYSACGNVITPNIDTPPVLTACACVRDDLLVSVMRDGSCVDKTRASYDAIFIEFPLWVDNLDEPKCALWSSDPDAPLEYLPRWGLFQYSSHSSMSPNQIRPRLSVVEYVQKRAVATTKRVNVSMKLSIPLLSVVLLERDAHSRPLFCAMISDTLLVIYGTSTQMDGNTTFTASVSSYNTKHDVWEPVIDPTNTYLKFSYSTTGDDSRPAGTAIAFKTIVPLSVSISRNFIASFLRWNAWQSQQALGLQQKFDRRALDENSILYENQLINQDVYVRTSSRAPVVCLKPNEKREVSTDARQAPSYVLPVDESKPLVDTKGDAEWPVRSAWHAILQIESSTFANHSEVAQLVASVEFSFPDGLQAVEVHTRAISPNSDEGQIKWDEAFHVVPRVSRASAPLTWREYADDVLVTFTVIDRHQVTNGSTAIATRSMTLTALFAALEMSVESYGRGIINIPCIDGDEVLQMTISLDIRVDAKRVARGMRGIVLRGSQKSEEELLVKVAFTPDGPWKPIYARESMQIIACGDTRCVVSSSGQGVCTFEPIATFVNNTLDTIEIAICPMGSHPDDAVGHQSRKKSHKYIEEVFENERFVPVAGWSSNHLIVTERRTWSNRHGAGSASTLQEFERDLLPPNFTWQGKWEINAGNETDKDGWAYARAFPDLKYPFNSSHKYGPLSFVRMRRWIRTRVLTVQPPEVVLTPSLEALLRLRVIVKPGESTGLLPSIIGPVAKSELFMRTVTPNGVSAWGVDVDEPDGVWTCMISGAMEGSVVARVEDSSGLQRFVGVRVEAVAVTSDASAEKASFYRNGDDENVEFAVDTSTMSWRVVAVPPHTIVNESPRTATVTIYQGEASAPMSAKAISVATITPGASLPVHTMHPDSPYYLKVALDDGFEMMVPKKRLLPISPVSIQAMSTRKSIDSFDMFANPSASGSDDAEESIDVVTLASTDGRSAVLDVRHDFGFLSRSSRMTTLSASILIMNKSGVDLVIRTSIIDSKSSKQDDVAASTLKCCQTHAPTSLRGIQRLRDTAIRRAPREKEELLLELGIATAGSDILLSPGITIHESELLRSAVIVQATCPDESIYSLTVRMENRDQINGESTTSSFSTQVVIIEPHYVLTNQTGVDLLIAQASTSASNACMLRASDANLPLKMQSPRNDGIVCVKLPDSAWSSPMNLRTIAGEALKIPVYSSAHPDEFQLLSLHANLSTIGVLKVRISLESRAKASIVIENASGVDVIAFRQAGSNDNDAEPWRFVPPRSTRPFAWSRPLDARKLNMCVLKNGSAVNTAYRTYDFDNFDQSISKEELPALPLSKIDFGQGLRELDIDGGDSVYFDFLPVSRSTRQGVCIVRVDPIPKPLLTTRRDAKSASMKASAESRVSVDIGECSLVLVDAVASEIINFSAGGFGMDYLTGAGAGISRASMVIGWLQIDDMKTGSTFPVVLRALRGTSRKHTFFSIKMVTKTSDDMIMRIYPYVDISFAPYPIQIAAHEPLVWRLVDFARVFGQNADAATAKKETRLENVDVPIAVDTMNVSALQLRLRFRSALYSRPKHTLPKFLVGVSFVNIDDSPLHLEPYRVNEVRALERAFWSKIKDSYTRQVVRQALALLAGVDVLDSFSQALGQASAGLSDMSLDSSFSTSMKKSLGGAEAQKADSVRAGFATGTEIFAKGVYRGFAGMIQKPLEGARQGGAAGFARGVGKGLVGAVTQPLAGGLAAVGRTAEGIAVGLDSVKSSLGVGALAPQHRIRHPRAEYADGVLRPWNRESSNAHRALATAVRGSLAGGSNQASVVFTHKGYYARDKYVASMEVNAKTVLVVLTNVRVVALERISPSESEEYVALWHVIWDEIADVETEEPGRVVLVLKDFTPTRPFDHMKTMRTVQCTPATQQSRVLAAMIRKELLARREDSQRGRQRSTSSSLASSPSSSMTERFL